MSERSQFYSSGTALFDFNRELSYDYSNNTFNPKISLRSYCFSASTASVSKPNFVYKPQIHYNHHSSRSASRSSSSSNKTSSSFQDLAFAAATVANAGASNNSIHQSFHHRTAVVASSAATDSGTVSPANMSDSETSNVSSPIPGTPLSAQTSISSMNNSSTSLNVVSNTSNTASTNSSSGDSKKKKRCNLPKKTTKILIDWLNENLNNPYPNSKEKFELIMKTGLTNQQLSNWFINARRRKINNLRENNNKLLQQQVQQAIPQK